MADASRRARDLDLLDLLDKYERVSAELEVWRLVREGRDPTIGGPSKSRWCDNTFDVLYTALAYDGAVAEIHSFLSMQPVFPSKDRWFCHKLSIGVRSALRLDSFDALGLLGIDQTSYPTRVYTRTQEIAGAAYFLGFDALIAPSARWSCLNAILFTDRLRPDQLSIIEEPGEPVSWEAWRRKNKG